MRLYPSLWSPARDGEGRNCLLTLHRQSGDVCHRCDRSPRAAHIVKPKRARNTLVFVIDTKIDTFTPGDIILASN